MRSVLHQTGPALLVAILAWLLLWARVAQIDASLPYPRQVDEEFLTSRASRIITKNDFDPGWFRYPSLPIYLTSAAMAVGFLRSAQHGDVKNPNDIGSVGLPHYAHPAVVAPARYLFALASVVAVVVYALLAARLARQRWVAPLVVGVIGASAFYFELSWTYLNVDILGATTTALALVASIELLEASGGAQRGLVAGLLAGLAASCKYNCGLVLGAAMVALALGRERQKRLPAAALALCGAGLGFLFGTPYALLNVRQFLTDVGFEAHHYASVHAGFSGQPGWRQCLTYTTDLVRSFGYGTLPFAGLGLVTLARLDFRGTCVLLTYPALLLGFLSQFRVQFARNAVSLHGIYAVLVAVGLWAAARAGARHALEWWATRRRPPGPWARDVLAGTLAVSCYALTANWSALRSQMHVEGDSRVRGASWLKNRLGAASVVLVPEELDFDLATLEGVQVQPLRVLTFSNPADFKAAVADSKATHALWPEWGRDPRFGGQEKLELVAALALRGDPLARFGKEPVLVNYPERAVPRGDPSYAIVRLSP